MILLVEDNPRDEALALRAFKKSNIVNEVIVAHDGVEALDYLPGTGERADGTERETPQFILLDLKLEQFMEATRQLGLYWLFLNLAAPTD